MQQQEENNLKKKITMVPGMRYNHHGRQAGFQKIDPSCGSKLTPRRVGFQRKKLHDFSPLFSVILTQFSNCGKCTPFEEQDTLRRKQNKSNERRLRGKK